MLRKPLILLVFLKVLAFIFWELKKALVRAFVSGKYNLFSGVNYLSLFVKSFAIVTDKQRLAVFRGDFG